MTSYSALSAVSVGLYTVLNVAAVTALATGGVGDDLPQLTGYPSVLYELDEKPVMHMGSQPGRSGQLPEITVRLHVFAQDSSSGGGTKLAQQVMDAAIGVLATAPSVSGYSSWAIFHDETINLGDQIVAGVKVKELVATFRLFVELQ